MAYEWNEELIGMVELRVLGPIEFVGPHGSAALGGTTQRRLLGVLASHAPHAIPTDQLVDELWQGEPPAAARRGFKSYVGRLRSALSDVGADDVVTTIDSGYALSLDPAAIDAVRFEQLVGRARAELSLGEPERALRLADDALELWRGPAFGEFGGEHWNEAWAAGLEATRTAAEELRLEIELARGRATEVLPSIEALVARFPYRDECRVLQARARYVAGDHVDALRGLQAYRSLLADELGVDPGAAVRDLERQILDHDPALLNIEPTTGRLHDYELLDRVGADEHSVVRLARQTSLGRKVAIRSVRPEFADDPGFVQRFEREARREALVDHPHVATVLDFWREPGSAHVVRRWLGGQSLAAHLEREGPLTAAAATGIVDDLGGALVTAHDLGIAHGAIDVDAVRIADDGTASLTGFRPVERALAGRSPASPADDVRALGHLLRTLITDAAGERACTDFDGIIERAAGEPPGYDGVSEFVGAVRDGLRQPLQREHRPARSGARNPFKGMRPFGEADADVFHGRDEFVRRMRRDLTASSFVAVVGPSGSGKSSAVLAGLVPRLRDDDVFVAVMRPGSQPFDELHRALVGSLPPPTARRDQVVAPTPASLRRLVRDSVPEGSRLVVVVDQFEELYTAADVSSRDRFIDALIELAAESDADVRVIVTMRADFYDRPLAHLQLGPLVSEHTVALTAMSPDELAEAITAPLATAGVTATSGLVADLVSEAAGRSAMLPVFQFALTELFEQRTHDVLDEQHLADVGGLAGLLARRADAVLADLGSASEPAARRLFTSLVLPGEGATDAGRRVDVAELAGIPELVIDAFTSARLIAAGHDPATRRPTVEIAHEALLTEWPRLRGWIDADRDELLAVLALRRAAREWDARGRDDDELYRGARLDDARTLVDSERLAGDAIAREFVEAAVAAADVEQMDRGRTSRRLRWRLAAAAIAAVLALGAVILAIQQRRNAAEAEREEEIAGLLADANALIGEDDQLATLLALEGWHLRPDQTSSDALTRALGLDTRRVATVIPRLEGVSELAISGDGSTLVIGNGREVEVIDLDRLAPVGDVVDIGSDVPMRGRNLSVDADGTTVAVIDQSLGSADLVVFDRGSTTTERRAIWDGTRTQLFDLAPNAAQTGADVHFAPGADVMITTDEVSSTIWSSARTAGERTPERLIAVSGDGRSVASSPGANVVTIHPIDDLTTGIAIDLADVRPHDEFFAEALLDHDARHLILRWDDEVTVHPIGDDLAPLAARPRHIAAGEPASIAVDARGRVAVAEVFGEIAVYGIETGAAIGRPFAVPPGAGPVVGFDATGRLVAAGEMVSVWSLDGDGPFSLAPLPGGRGVAVSPDGRFVATTTEFCEVFISSGVDGSLLATGRVPDTTIFTPVAMGFSPDGTLLAVGGGVGPCTDRDVSEEFGTGQLVLVDAATGETVAEWQRDDTGNVTALSWSDDGSSIVIGDVFGGVEHLSVPSLDTIGRRTEMYSLLTAPKLRGVAFDEAGDRILAVNPVGEVAIIDASSGELESIEEDVNAPNLLAALPDGQLISGENDGSLRRLDIDGSPIGEPIDGHLLVVVSMSIGDEMAVTGSLDSLRFWSVPDLTPIGPAIPGREVFTGSSRDGSVVAVGSDGAAGLWSLDPADWVERACDIAGRNLTREEWDRYLPSGEPYRATCPA